MGGDVAFTKLVRHPGIRPSPGNLADRLAEAQTGNPFPPRVILWTGPGLTLEQALHARFEVYRLRGERFEFPADQDSVVAVVQAVQELADGA